MVQIIPENRRTSFAESIMGGLAEGIAPAIQNYQNQQNRAKATKTAGGMLGMDLSGFDPETIKALMVEKLKQEGKFGRQAEQQGFLDKLFNKSGKNIDSSGSLSQDTNQNKFDPSQISDKDIVIGENLGIKGLREAKDASIKKKEGENKEKRRQFESDREYHSKGSDPIIKEAQAVLKNSPITKSLLQQQRRDVRSGNTSGLLPFLVDTLGLESFRNPESARFKNAVKERFIETIHSMGSAGTRMNQFLEKQLSSAQTAIGRDQEANESVLDMEEFVMDMKNARAKEELRLADEDREKYGYVKNDIGSRADKFMKKYAEQRQEEMAYDIRKRHEENLDDNQLLSEIFSKGVVPDTPLTMRVARILMIKNNDDEKKAQAEAKRLGFTIPSDKTFMRK